MRKTDYLKTDYLITIAALLGLAAVSQEWIKRKPKETDSNDVKVSTVQDISTNVREPIKERHYGIRRDHFYYSIDELSEEDRQDVFAFNKLAEDASYHVAGKRAQAFLDEIMGTNKSQNEEKAKELVDPMMQLQNFILNTPINLFEELVGPVARNFSRDGKGLTELLDEAKGEISKVNEIMTQFAYEAMQQEMFKRRINTQTILWDYVGGNVPYLDFDRRSKVVQAIYSTIERKKDQVDLRPPSLPWKGSQNEGGSQYRKPYANKNSLFVNGNYQIPLFQAVLTKQRPYRTQHRSGR